MEGLGAGRKRGRSDLSSDGDETPPRSEGATQQGLGSLHQRRVSASPDKFAHGFDPLPLRKTDTEKSPAKKPRLEITYDAMGTPILTAFPRSQVDEKKSFSLLNALMRDNNLLLTLVSYLSLPSLASLYAISKTFHYLFNTHATAFVLAIMRTWAPNADKIFPWRYYQSLCLKDPGKRQKKRLEGKDDKNLEAYQAVRDVPSLKWLKMVVYREGVSRDILVQLAVKGLRCPPGTLEALKKSWFLLDLPLNAHRIALIRSTSYFTPHTLANLTTLHLKLDMAFTNPAGPVWPLNHPNQYLYPNRYANAAASGVPLRKLLLAEKSLTPLWRMLRGWSPDPSDPQIPATRMDMLRLFVRHRYRLPDRATDTVKKMSIMSVPWYEVGMAGMERTGVSFYDLLTPEGETKTVAITHPSIVGSGLTPHAQQQLQQQNAQGQLYPHASKRPLQLPQGKAVEKAREPLLRPDELVLKESVRRKLQFHRRWIYMMLWGFCDAAGVNWPVFTEEEILRMMKGLSPRKEEKEDGEAEEMSKEKKNITLKLNEK